MKKVDRPINFTENQHKFLNTADLAINMIINDMCLYDNIYLNDFQIKSNNSLFLLEMAKMTQYIKDNNFNIYINCNLLTFLKLKLKFRKSKIVIKKANKEQLRKIKRQIKVKPNTNTTDMVIDNGYLFGYIIKHKLPILFFKDIYDIYYNQKISAKQLKIILEKIEQDEYYSS